MFFDEDMLSVIETRLIVHKQIKNREFLFSGQITVSNCCKHS